MSLPFSIIMPVYNGQKYLEEAIKSNLNQTFEDFEIVIGNDGSNDETSEIIHSYAKKDKRIVVIDRKYNMGLYQTLNQLQGISRGDYIVTLSHDDISPPNRLEEVYKYFKKNPDIDLCGNFMKMFGNSERIKKSPLNHDYIKYIHTPFIGIGTACVNMKREVMEQFPYRYQYGYAGDKEFIGRILLESDFKISTIPKVLHYFRDHEANGSYGESEFAMGLYLHLHYISKLYKLPIDPVIDYTLGNLNNLTNDILLKTQHALLNMSEQLDRHYSKQIGANLGDLFKRKFAPLLKAGQIIKN